MPIPEQVLNEIKYRNEIEDVISPYVALKRRGKNLIGLCPFHNEKTPSFTVYPENGSFYCFGCHVGGDVFTFTKLIENLDYMEAVHVLAERAGVTLTEVGYDDSVQRMKNTLYDINREAARFYHKYLMSPQGKWALDYLTGRGLTVETIRHFGLGAAPDSWDGLLNHLHRCGYSTADLVQADVILKSQRGSYYDRFRKRIMFPIIDIRGRVIAFSGRAMPGDDKKGAKYVNTGDTPIYKKGENLFGINFAKAHCAERLILVEGNMDVVSLHQAGFENTVAALGTAFKPEQAKLISRYTKEIVLTMDGDSAGQSAIRKACEKLQETGLNIRIVTIPDGKDPDDYIKEFGAAKFTALLDSAINEIEFKLFSAAQTVDVESDAGKVQYLSAAAKILAETSDDIARDLYIGRLCDRFGITRTTLENRVNQLRAQRAKEVRKKEIHAVINPRYSREDVNPERRNNIKGTAAEETLISVLLQHPDLCAFSKEGLPEDKMLTTLNRRIYSRILQCSDSGRTIEISSFSDFLSPVETGYLVSLQNGVKGSQNPQKVLTDCISVILEEGTLKNVSDMKDTSVDDWANQLKQMIEKKQKGN